jgi:hypothetical protein
MVLAFGGLYGLFLIVVGAAFILSPEGAVTAFGIDPSHMADLAVAPLAGARSVALGGALLLLALFRERMAVGLVLLAAAALALFDFSVASRAFGVAGAWRHLVPGVLALVAGVALALGGKRA